MPKRILILLAAVLALLSGVAQPADASARGDDNEARAVNITDGSSIFDLAVSIRRTAEVDVIPTNVAMAYAKCESCQTVAIAFQVVLAVGPTATVEASNAAVAVNDQCRKCETFAAAHQFVVATGGPVRFTREGWRELQSIRRELKSLRHSGLLASELRDRVDSLAVRLHHAVTTELRAVRPAHLRDSRSRLEAHLGRIDERLPDRTERREARKHAHHRFGLGGSADDS